MLATHSKTSQVTKDAREISLRIIQGCPDPFNKPYYATHLVEAYVDDKIAGYLRIAVVTQELCDKFLPTVWHWKSKVKGMCVSDVDDVAAVWATAHLHEGFGAKSRPGVFYTSLKGEEPDLETMKADLIDLAKKSGVAYAFKEWKKKCVNKPFVDYSCVLRRGDKYEGIESTESFRGLGVAKAMYIHMAEWLYEEHGLRLESSACRVDESTGVWESLRKAGLPITVSKLKSKVGADTTMYKFDF